MVIILFSAPTVTCPDPLRTPFTSIAFPRPEISNFPDNDDVYMQYSVNGHVVPVTVLHDGTHDLILLILPIGQHTVQVSASDELGNTATCSFTVEHYETGMY